MMLWLIAAVMSALVLVPVLRSLIVRRRDPAKSDDPVVALLGRLRLTLAAAVLLPVAAAVLYLTLDSPRPVRSGPPGDGLERLSAEELVARLEQVLASRPKDAKGWTLLGNARMALGRYLAAAEAYRTALAAGGDAALIGPRLAEAERRTAMIEDMVAQLEARMGASPADFQGWLMLARAQAGLERPGKARAALDRALILAAGDEVRLLQVRDLAAALNLSPAAESRAGIAPRAADDIPAKAGN